MWLKLQTIVHFLCVILDHQWIVNAKCKVKIVHLLAHRKWYRIIRRPRQLKCTVSIWVDTRLVVNLRDQVLPKSDSTSCYIFSMNYISFRSVKTEAHQTTLSCCSSSSVMCNPELICGQQGTMIPLVSHTCMFYPQTLNRTKAIQKLSIEAQHNLKNNMILLWKQVYDKQK